MRRIPAYCVHKGRNLAYITVNGRNPHAKRVAWLREALLEAVSEDDLRAIARTLVKKAKGGDLPAIGELLNRAIGKAPYDAEASPPEVILVRTGVPEPDNDWRS